MQAEPTSPKGLLRAIAEQQGCFLSNREERKMQNREADDSLKAFRSDPMENGCHTPKKLSYDGDWQRLPTEGTVIWIAKDSESESEEYLEECNTHQNGE